jgi:hypothetical protein
MIGSLSKPFTSESLINAVKNYLAGGEDVPEEMKPVAPEETPLPPRAESQDPGPALIPPYSLESNTELKPLEVPVAEPLPVEAARHFAEPAPIDLAPPPSASHQPPFTAPVALVEAKDRSASSNAYFCGDSSFFSLHWALQTIAREALTGTLHAFWAQDSVELLARDGRVVLVTTRNPSLYCEEAPVTLLNVERARIEAASARQTADGCPIFVTLAKDGLILREPGLQLVQHYGQKLFSQLWTDRVRFTFEQQELPGYSIDLPSLEDHIDQWALSTLRFVQYQELDTKAMPDTSSVPAYTLDGYERVQQLRLAVAEAQFASQFNGSRSIAQISKNLRLDVKFARLTLFRFLALEIVECWPAQLAQKPELHGGIRGIFGR